MGEWKEIKKHVMEKFLYKVRISVDVYKEAVMVSFKEPLWNLHMQNIPCHHSLSPHTATVILRILSFLLASRP
jgi:hypothetical protein